MDAAAGIVDALAEVRARTLGIVEHFDDAALCAQHSRLVSPLVWDLAHVGNYEDLWLLRALGKPGVAPEVDDLYNAFAHARSTRAGLALLAPQAARRYIGEVRHRVLDTLGAGHAVAGAPAPLVAEGFVYGMAVQHEHQHDETMLAAIQLMEGPTFDPALPGTAAPGGRAGVAPSLGRTPALPAEVVVPGGPFTMGATDAAWAYDNERPAYAVEVPTFAIDTTAVTNAAYCAFVASGAYGEHRLWDEAGRAWLAESGASAPAGWARSGPEADPADAAGGWTCRTFGRTQPLDPDAPVQHVCAYEADAYARWAGRRLPTEAEWEKAASWDASSPAKLRYPWGNRFEAGRANLGQLRASPSPASEHLAGASPCGALQMLGDVWEWTASPFRPYPGFRSFPYREYSEVFFGDVYRVLRGGSWATHPAAMRTTFRNWDFPVRRHIFAGFRTARDL
ncbi:MAG: ergothioneine biosynthesis protein EgtB [Actinomycetota bacterium]|nr:ergothioneine biosynthesis protein EgtB [Actinomycetota bacterium]